MYVDGVLEASTTWDYFGTFTIASPLNIGYLIDGYHFMGRLDEAAIYNRALTAAEIQGHYNGGAGQSYCDDAPIVYLPLAINQGGG
jgi:hypothetical protein